MQEPGIIARINELKSKFESETDEKLAEFDKHGERLAKLEEGFGFDLDIATDIYGDKLLDPLDTEGVLEKWEQLLAEIAENPGGYLVLLRPVTVSTGIHSIAHDPNIRYKRNDIEIAVVKGVDTDSFVYVPEDLEQENPENAYIGIKGSVHVHYPGRKDILDGGFSMTPDEEGLVLAQDPGAISLMPGVVGIGNSGVVVMYNQPWNEISNKIQSLVDADAHIPYDVLVQLTAE